jgi:AcrR family transcriptional regulator
MASVAEDGRRPGRRDSRRSDILAAAAQLFGERGYEATTVRDIASAVNMLPGSMYYHFPSKEELLIAVHEEGVAAFEQALTEALAGKVDPWERFEAAAIAHIEVLTAGGTFAAVVSPEFARRNPEVQDRLISQRDGYEQRFIALVDALELASDVDRKMLRLHLFGALNWTTTWFRPNGRPASEIARDIVRVIRNGASPRL